MYVCNTVCMYVFIYIYIYIYIYISGVGRCQKVCGGGGGGTQTRNLYTFGKEPI